MWTQEDHHPLVCNSIYLPSCRNNAAVCQPHPGTTFYYKWVLAWARRAHEQWVLWGEPRLEPSIRPTLPVHTKRIEHQGLSLTRYISFSLAETSSIFCIYCGKEKLNSLQSNVIGWSLINMGPGKLFLGACRVSDESCWSSQVHLGYFYIPPKGESHVLITHGLTKSWQKGKDQSVFQGLGHP